MMNEEAMKSLKPGDKVVYNDGRPGHTNSTAEVLENDGRFVIVQFEDRARSSFIAVTDLAWTKHLTRA